jgi:hypothetical protein
MAVDLSTLPSYTDAELLKAVRYAIAQVLVGGQSITLMGRTFTRADLTELQKIAEVLQEKVDQAASATGTLTALARFGSQQ